MIASWDVRIAGHVVTNSYCGYQRPMARGLANRRTCVDQANQLRMRNEPSPTQLTFPFCKLRISYSRAIVVFIVRSEIVYNNFQSTMAQRSACINLTVYEKAPKKPLYKIVTLAGKQCRRVAVLGVSTADGLCKRLLANVATDALYDFASEDAAVSIPEDANEFCAEDVAHMAIGFVKGQVCRARIVDIAVLDEPVSPCLVRRSARVSSLVPNVRPSCVDYFFWRCMVQ
jgi:hypothetical protein